MPLAARGGLIPANHVGQFWGLAVTQGRATDIGRDYANRRQGNINNSEGRYAPHLTSRRDNNSMRL